MSQTEEKWLGQWPLQRFPNYDKSLRAWDAADEYICAQILPLLKPGQKVLLVNDSFGALAVGFCDSTCASLGDSFLSRQGLGFNWPKFLELKGAAGADQPASTQDRPAPSWFTLAGPEEKTGLPNQFRSQLQHFLQGQ